MALAVCLLLQPFSAYAVDYIKKGETKTFQKDGYVFSSKEAKVAAENQRKVKQLEKQLEEYKKLTENLKQESALKDQQISLIKEEAIAYRKMYANSQMAYEREKDRNNKFYNKPWFWFTIGAVLSTGAIVGGSQINN